MPQKPFSNLVGTISRQLVLGFMLDILSSCVNEMVRKMPSAGGFLGGMVMALSEGQRFSLIFSTFLFYKKNFLRDKFLKES